MNSARRFKIILTAGFAMFSMFLGSGNLVFPLLIGVKTSSEFLSAIFGLLVTGVLVPFLGLFGVILFKGNYSSYFGSIGKVPAFILTLFILALLGPFGVVPRCILVSYGSFSFFSEVNFLPLFSLIFCILSLLLIWKHDRIIPIVGRVLTPWLILGVTVLIIGGIWIKDPQQTSLLSSPQAFSIGLKQGYLTMDLLAAFFFSTVIVSYLKNKAKDDLKTLMSLCFCSSLIGAGLLASVYVGFVVLGAEYSDLLRNISPEQILITIANHSLGNFATPIVSITIFLACITTAAVLTMLFADFLSKEVTQGKLKHYPAILVTITISYILSLVGFQTLSNSLDAVLQITYPALIALTIANIIHKVWAIRLNRWFFWLTLGASIFLKLGHI